MQGNGSWCNVDRMCSSGFCNISNNGGTCEAKKKIGEKCPSKENDQCADNLVCAKNNKDDEIYICCRESYVPSWWTTEVCK
jgi:hypothetical protein